LHSQCITIGRWPHSMLLLGWHNIFVVCFHFFVCFCSEFLDNNWKEFCNLGTEFEHQGQGQTVRILPKVLKMKTFKHLRHSEHHLPYGFTQCYLPFNFCLTSAIQAGTWFAYPRGTKGWVDLDAGYAPRWFICLQTVTHPNSNRVWCIRTTSSTEIMFAIAPDFHFNSSQADL